MQNADSITGVGYAGDYDDRTCLHLAASCGKISVVQYLIEVDGLNMDPIDRFGGTPLDDAYRWDPLPCCLQMSTHVNICNGDSTASQFKQIVILSHFAVEDVHI